MHNSKAFKIAIKEIQDLNSFYIELLPALVITVGHVHNAGMTQETIEACKLALLDYFDDGCEHEWQSDLEWKYWEEINIDWFSPYETTRFGSKEKFVEWKCNKHINNL